MTAAKTPARKPRAAKASPSAAARRAEAEDGIVLIEHRGITLRVPVGGKTPIAAFDAFAAGNNYEGTKILLGPEQWKALSDAGMVVGELDELGEKFRAHWGK